MNPRNDGARAGNGQDGLPTWRAAPEDSTGRFEGAPHGSPVSGFVVDAAPGEGPSLHRHPYSETFIVQAGRARFTLAGREVVGVAGDLVVVPPQTAHGFNAVGPERLQMVAIHAAPRIRSTSLAEPAAA